MKPYVDKNSLISEVRSMVKNEIENAIKKIQSGKVNSYTSIMKNSKIDVSDIYSSIPNYTNREIYDNKNAYVKMKNRVNYGFSSDSKTYVNKAGSKPGK